MQAWSVYDIHFGLEIVGGNLFDLTNRIAMPRPVERRTYVQHYVAREIGDNTPQLPRLFFTGYEASMSLNGLLTDEQTKLLLKDVVQDGKREARFIMWMPNHGWFGPLGNMNINDAAPVSADGIITIDKAGIGNRKEVLNYWQYGKMSGKNPDFAWRASNNNTAFGDPNLSQAVVVYVLEGGGYRGIDVSYRHPNAGEVFTFQVPLDTYIRKGIHVGFLQDGGTNIYDPARNTGGQWQVDARGSASRSGYPDAEFYVGVIGDI
ncbi:MAG: hypothetical protein OXE52_13765 [Chloroflexi bacterium]|nr:hypothetical protein [Chloroflexota bacterium]